MRLLQVDAREPQELVDHANRVDERLVADAAGSQSLVPQGRTFFGSGAKKKKAPSCVGPRGVVEDEILLGCPWDLVNGL